MSRWMSAVLKELEGLNQKGLLEPKTEVGPTDHVVGEANVEIRKLYGLAMQTSRRSAESIVSAQYDINRETQEHHAAKAVELRKKAELLMEIFWVSIKDQFDLWQKPSVGIRKGWKVVWSEPGPDSILDLLGTILDR